MVAVNTRSDALHFELGGTRIQTLAAVGTLPGVILRQVSALNGPGVGRISSVGDGSAVRWQAPQSDRAGTPVTITGDGEYLLEDGEDIGRFLRIEAVQSFLKPQAMASRVYLKEVYLNGFAQQDVTAHPTTFQFVVYSTISLVTGLLYLVGILKK